jgi:hypothetical protein
MSQAAATIALFVVALLVSARAAIGQSALAGDTIHIVRTTTAITIDGELGEEEWRAASRVKAWYEINPGDNIAPRVANLGLLAYDDRFFYAAFEFEDPSPSSIRAPLGDRDNVPGFTDYAGVIIDTRGDGKSAMMMLVNARGVQYDAITDDSSGEDSSPDFFWDSATRITDRGWTLEIRIPFSSLRYRNADPQTWGILLYRNHPRDFRYQIFSARLPRGSNCFICRSNTLVGLESLPGGGHLVAAPYVSGTGTSRPSDGPGSALRREPFDTEIGLDAKWTPDADNALDFTINPDFSQVEADTAQISANERFALFFPEKRPFFLEGVDIFATPLQAVYTRTITAPDWGGRATGKLANVRYTALVADDDGGGSVILPGSDTSSFAPQEFGSTVFVGRAKRDIGLSFVSVLATDREARGGAGHNRLVGPDFQWRATEADVVQGQWLYSHSRAPNRPDLAPEWTGETLSGTASHLSWNHSTSRLDWFGQFRHVNGEFRADTGFMPQVGYQELFGYTGWTARPRGFVSRVRPFLTVMRQTDQDGGQIARMLEPGVGMDTKLSGFMRFQYVNEEIRSGGEIFGRQQFGFYVSVSPTRRIAEIRLDGNAGEEIDFANSRVGHGAIVNLSARLNPTDHLELQLLQNQQWLNIEGERLFTARVSRLRGVYTFTPRSFVRAIGQYINTERDPSLYLQPVTRRMTVFSGSALFAYKLNWQSVLFVGYGDDRELSERERIAPANRQFFIKISYAFQR